MRLEPDAIGALGSRLQRGSALISATNGKTTTATMTAAILRRAGVSLVHNQAGANMAGGVATALLGAAAPAAGIAGELGLFEVDELWLAAVAAELHPRAILLSNLFRDQLDRYGELERIAESWEEVLGGPATRARSSTPTTPRRRPRPRAPADARTSASRTTRWRWPGMSHAADAKHCRRCGAPYVFDAVYLGHLGHYHCDSCGQRRPTPALIAGEVVLHGVRARSSRSDPRRRGRVALALPGLYNVYNALAAAALASALDVPLAAIVAGLRRRPARLRARREHHPPPIRPATGATVAEPRELRILLVKNPAGANEVLRTLALEPGQHDLLGVLNDNIADGRDVSWIWDADFELLAGRIRRVTCSGTPRCPTSRCG